MLRYQVMVHLMCVEIIVGGRKVESFTIERKREVLKNFSGFQFIMWFIGSVEGAG